MPDGRRNDVCAHSQAEFGCAASFNWRGEAHHLLDGAEALSSLEPSQGRINAAT
jgi:hypothetical protein